MDSYFEILLYVGLHFSFISGLGEEDVAEDARAREHQGVGTAGQARPRRLAF